MRSSEGFGSLSSSALAEIRKPGVQMPHWRAAFSRNACCSGWSWPVWAMPSTVVMFLPCASTPRTRQELTMRPSMRTVQAPQLPSLQPSLAPVRFNTSRSVSSRLWRGSTRNSVSSPLMVAVTWIFAGALVAGMDDLPSCAGGRAHQDAAGDDADQVLALRGGAAHVADRLGGGLGDLGGRAERLLGGWLALEGGAGLLDEQRRRRDSGQRDARRADGLLVVAQLDLRAD